MCVGGLDGGVGLFTENALNTVKQHSIEPPLSYSANDQDVNGVISTISAVLFEIQSKQRLGSHITKFSSAKLKAYVVPGF